MIAPQVVCPNWPDPEDGDLLGCGSTNVVGPDYEGLYDCLDCGIWFKLEQSHRNPSSDPDPNDPTECRRCGRNPYANCICGG